MNTVGMFLRAQPLPRQLLLGNRARAPGARNFSARLQAVQAGCHLQPALFVSSRLLKARNKSNEEEESHGTYHMAHCNHMLEDVEACRVVSGKLENACIVPSGMRNPYFPTVPY